MNLEEAMKLEFGNVVHTVSPWLDKEHLMSSELGRLGKPVMIIRGIFLSLKPGLKGTSKSDSDGFLLCMAYEDNPSSPSSGPGIMSIPPETVFRDPVDVLKVQWQETRAIKQLFDRHQDQIDSAIKACGQ